MKNACIVGYGAIGPIHARGITNAKKGNLYAVEQVLQRNPEELQKAEAIVLLVRAGEDRGKAIEYALHELQVMNCKAEAALLTDADDKLIQIYRFGKKG